MSLEINLTGVEKTSNKKTSLADNSDTFYPTQKAVKTAVDAKEDSSNKSTSTSDSGSSTKFPVWSAILSYFDASRIKTILGITTLSGSNTGDQDLSGYVPTTRTINGYDLSANRTLTASDVGAVDNSSSAILTALGWWQYNRVSESTAVTGTTSETIIENITIPANTYANGGILRFYNSKFRKVGTNGTLAIRVYINSTSNNLSGATLIASFTGIASSNIWAEILRTWTCTTSAIVGFNASQSSSVDTGNSSATRASNAVDWTVAQYLIITVQLSNASDSVTLIGASAKNF
jgi:hypothetical protein